MEIVKFNNEQFGELRIADIEGNPWFVARDVAEALGYKDAINAVKLHCKGVVKYHPYKQRVSDGVVKHDPYEQDISGGQAYNIIPESDFYRLVLRSKLPNAERFQDWVTSEVLPSIRKTGTYSLYERVDSADLSMKCEFLKQVRLSAQNLPGWQRRQAIVQSLESVGLRVKAGINDETADFVNAVVTKDIQYFEHLKENHPTLYDSIASNFERNRIRSNDIIKAYQIMCNPTLSSKAVMAKIREYDSRFSVSEVSRISSEKYYKIQ